MKEFSYLKNLVFFAIRSNPFFLYSLIFSAASILLELAAMSTLMPLASVAAGNQVSSDSFVTKAMERLHFNVNSQNIFYAFLILFSARIITLSINQYLVIYNSKKFLHYIITGMVSVFINKFSLAQIEDKSIGYFTSLVGDEAYKASNLVLFMNQLVSLILLALLYFAAIFMYSNWAALCVLLFIVLSFILLLGIFRYSLNLGGQQITVGKKINSQFIDALNSLRTIRSFTSESYIISNYSSGLLEYTKILSAIDVASLLSKSIPAVILLILMGVVVYCFNFGQQLLVNLPLLATLVILLLRFFPIVGQILSLTMRIVSDARSGKDVTSLLVDHHLAEETNNDKRIFYGVVEEIEFSHVSFSYTAGKRVFSNMNFLVKKGKSYAIIGPSGSGKSTAFDLLLRFYNPNEGVILINGINIQELKVADIRTNINLVVQDVAIFNDTVAHNLCLGENYSVEEITHACRIACIDEYINTLEHGYNTPLNYQGSNLSGGQKQRLGIARALLRKPQVLLIDEATNAVDSNTRKILVKNLIDEFKDKMIIFISHDRTVESSVDVILDMRKLIAQN